MYCKAFVERMPHAACAWYTLPGPQWAQNSKSIDYLWTMRYHVSTLIAQLKVNVLVLDLDCIIRRDVYVDLKRPPLQDVQLIHLEEGVGKRWIVLSAERVRARPLGLDTCRGFPASRCSLESATARRS